MNKKDLRNELVERIKIKSLRLPSTIDFSVKEKTLYIIVNKGSGMNMQENSSSFEGWAACLKFNLPELIEEVNINWDINTVTRNLHYNRFLYRVWKFINTYPWAKCNNKDVVGFNTADWVINYPKQEAKEKAENPEAKLERVFISSHESHYDCICNQLPVGLFKKEVRRDTRVTPGQNSQIDIWAIRKETLNIFELKVDTNRSVGIISELMFYVNVMSDLSNGLIKFYGETKIRNFDKLYKSINEHKINIILGHFLTNNLHPLITPCVLRGLNTSLNSKIAYCHTNI